MGSSFTYDANAGQKTGAFLDQRANYAAAREWAVKLGSHGPRAGCLLLPGRVCAASGARFASSVTGIDASRASLEVAERNLEANREQLQARSGLGRGRRLRDSARLVGRGRAVRHDRARSPGLCENAAGGRRRAARLQGTEPARAARCCGPGGLLVTCSCSHHVGWADLEGAVAAAAADAHGACGCWNGAAQRSIIRWC